MNSTDVEVAVSTVTPVYSGEHHLETLVAELEELRRKWIADGAPVQLCEAIFVADEPVDDSCRVLQTLKAKFDWVKLINLSRNYGQHPATVAGILHSSGDWIVTLDEDLQHPPSKIELLLGLAVSEGQDIVYSRPRQSIHESWSRDLTSRLFKRLMAIVTRDNNVVLFNSFRMIRGSVARAASSVCSHETYFDIALSWFTQRVGCATMDLKDDRVIGGGRSGYDMRKLLSHARRMLVSSRLKMLRGGAFVGFFALLLSVLFGGYVTISQLMNPGVFGMKGWSSLMVAVLFFGGITAFLLGASLEYLTVLLLKAQGKPTFFVVDRSADAKIADYLKGKLE